MERSKATLEKSPRTDARGESAEIGSKKSGEVVSLHTDSILEMPRAHGLESRVHKLPDLRQRGALQEKAKTR